MNVDKRSEQYNLYMGSLEWYRKRKEAISAAGHQCQECSLPESKTVRLYVHHLTYENFGNERPKDLKVLCKPCHRAADEERAERVTINNEQSLYDAQLDGWATKVYGEDWQEYENLDCVVDEFNDWLERREY